MKSLRDLYKIGKGPSSSHTIGPERAARKFLERAPEADRFTVILYGSLSKTGVGHGTDRVLKETLGPDRTEIVFSAEDPADLPHPNTMDFIAYKGETELLRMRVMSSAAAISLSRVSRKPRRTTSIPKARLPKSRSSAAGATSRCRNMSS